MSNDIKNFFGKIKGNFNMATKFNANNQAGSRIVPSRTAKNDADYQLRIDAGELVGGKRNVILQVNSQAKSTPLKEWLRKHGSHAKLAQATFDTAAKDPK